MPSILDIFPYPHAVAEAQQLHQTLVQVKPTVQSAVLIAGQAGIDMTIIDTRQPVLFVWKDILDQAAIAGLTHLLVQLVFDQLDARSPARPFLAGLLADKADTERTVLIPEKLPERVQPFRVPYRRNPLFVGREAVLQQLDAGMAPPLATIAICGLGGLGKTQLAVEWAYRAWERGDFRGGVFWINMDPHDGVADQVAAFARPEGLNLPGWNSAAFEQNLAAVQDAWAQPLARLLVFDNLNPEDLALLEKWRPKVGGCRMLITSHRSPWPAHLGVQALTLAVLDRPTSRDLLLTPRGHILGMTVAALLDDPATAEASDAICAKLGDLPLALAMAATYLEIQSTTPLERYLKQVQDEASAHPALNQEWEASLPTGHAPSILATFALSYNRLRTADLIDTLARTVLHRAAHLAPTLIPRRLLMRAAELDPDNEDAKEQMTAALRRLAVLGLIELLPEDAARLHRLLAGYANMRAPEPTADQANVEAALIAEVGNVNEQLNPSEGLLYLEHLRFVVADDTSRADESVVRLLNTLGLLIEVQGDLASAQDPYRRALSIAERALDPNHLLTARTLGKLGGLLWDLGDPVGAEPLIRRALEIRERTCGPDDPETAVSVHNLGRLFLEQGDLATAQPLLERALHIREQTLRAIDPAIAWSLIDLGRLSQKQGDLKTARSRLERSVNIYERTKDAEHPLDAEHPFTARALINLADVLQEQGEFRDAYGLLERALKIRERAFGSIHPKTASIVNRLATLCQLNGDTAKAQVLFERALAIRVQTLGPSHRDTNTSRNNLAGLLTTQGD